VCGEEAKKVIEGRETKIEVNGSAEVRRQNPKF
jgi:ribosome-associated protein YbcJ (S4-like RNA binding protein)